ncbi:MAG: hypothetical protein AUK16_03170 [Parcubacteria group bacterium CG2_30_44_11]|nr:MAG: hypothetical protein AUK16_03170 [Parcubacteria group bacterium CG2_30_44_11]
MQTSLENTTTSRTTKPDSIPETTIAITSPTHSNLKIYLGFAVAILLAMFLMSYALVYASRDSLPGEPLYTFKTNIAEELSARTKLGATAQTEFALQRIETRFTELQMLAADEATTTPDTLQVVASLANEHAKTVVETLDTDNSLSPETKMEALVKLTYLTRAGETLSDTVNEFKPIREQISVSEELANNSLKNTINTFVSTSDPEVVSAFLVTQMADVSTTLPNVANGSRAQRLAVARVNDMNEAIEDNQMAEAIKYILKAKEAIAIDAYLYDSERGFVDGITPEILPMPEGS